jgi:alcohol dehydrogenase
MSDRSWKHFNPVRVVFGTGALNQLPELVDSARVVLITTPGFRRRGLTAEIEAAFGERLVTVIEDVKPNPSLVDIEVQAGLLRGSRPEVLLAVGGGSTIDTGKAVARLLSQPPGTNLAALLRGEAQPEFTPALPLVAIPTTSGTGAEVTPFGTVWDFCEGKKYSVVGDDLFPRLAVLDPELTLRLPAEVTVTSGLDAVSHALESTWNRNSTPISLALAMKSLQFALRALPIVKDYPGNLAARADMMQASMLAGLAISQSRTALAHAISYPLTTSFNLPHGLACSFTLPALLSFNASADDGRLRDLARNLGYTGIDEFERGLADLFKLLGVGGYLAKYLPDRSSVMALTNRMFAPGRTENNLRQASEEDVRTLVAASLDALDG